MLTSKDKSIIKLYTRNGSHERYPEEPMFYFKGRHAFDLHSKLVSLIDSWVNSFSEAQKKSCSLLATVQTTITDAYPQGRIKRIRLYFFSQPGETWSLPSGVAFSSAKGKKWFKLLSAEPNNLLV